MDKLEFLESYARMQGMSFCETVEKYAKDCALDNMRWDHRGDPNDPAVIATYREDLFRENPRVKERYEAEKREAEEAEKRKSPEYQEKLQKEREMMQKLAEEAERKKYQCFLSDDKLAAVSEAMIKLFTSWKGNLCIAETMDASIDPGDILVEDLMAFGIMIVAADGVLADRERMLMNKIIGLDYTTEDYIALLRDVKSSPMIRTVGKISFILPRAYAIAAAVDLGTGDGNLYRKNTLSLFQEFGKMLMAADGVIDDEEKMWIDSFNQVVSDLETTKNPTMGLYKYRKYQMKDGDVLL